jgi:hypothetical protein
MTQLRPLPRDPRTVARDIPSTVDALFPQLSPGVVMHLNNSARSVLLCDAVSEELVDASKLQHAMLFELAFAVGEQTLVDADTATDWQKAIDSAVRRQRRHFDAKLPDKISEADKAIAEHVGNNMAWMLEDVAEGDRITCSPHIPGYQWVASGNGDFSAGSKLIEVKCVGKRFGSSDYRQVLIYWLLSFAASIEGRGDEWETGVLLNPRRNEIVEIRFDELIAAVAAGRSKVDVLELFAWLVGDHSARAIDRV